MTFLESSSPLPLPAYGYYRSAARSVPASLDLLFIILDLLDLLLYSIHLIYYTRFTWYILRCFAVRASVGRCSPTLRSNRPNRNGHAVERTSSFLSITRGATFPTFTVRRRHRTESRASVTVSTVSFFLTSLGSLGGYFIHKFGDRANHDYHST